MFAGDCYSNTCSSSSSSRNVYHDSNIPIKKTVHILDNELRLRSITDNIHCNRSIPNSSIPITIQNNNIGRFDELTHRHAIHGRRLGDQRFYFDRRAKVDTRLICSQTHKLPTCSTSNITGLYGNMPHIVSDERWSGNHPHRLWQPPSAHSATRRTHRLPGHPR